MALPFLRDGRQAGFLFLPEGEDPDTLVRGEGRAGFERRLEHATPLADYLFAELRVQTDTSTLAGLARLAELARPLLEKLPDGNFRDLMEKRLDVYKRQLVDCISFIIMTKRNLTDALTTDEHFQQAGFRALLKENAS